MKKSNRPAKTRETSSDKTGRWSFNLASENLFTLGSADGARRVAYRTATGELRYLPT